MNKKHRKTLEAIFRRPAAVDVRWSDVEALFKHLSAEITEGRGSRIRVALNGIRAVFHRPHPKKVTDKGALASVRKFLNHTGVSHE